MTWGNKWSGEGSNAVVYVSLYLSNFYTHTHTHTAQTKKTGTQRCNLSQVES